MIEQAKNDGIVNDYKVCILYVRQSVYLFVCHNIFCVPCTLE